MDVKPTRRCGKFALFSFPKSSRLNIRDLTDEQLDQAIAAIRENFALKPLLHPQKTRAANHLLQSCGCGQLLRFGDAASARFVGMTAVTVTAIHH
jgi:hypothetical protein